MNDSPYAAAQAAMQWQINIASSTAATLMRAGAGVVATPTDKRPQWLLELYDIEGCPDCRLVREVITELDLDAMIYPCPKGGDRFRTGLESSGTRRRFPCLVDPNTGTRMLGSADVIGYLFETYGRNGVPLQWRAPDLYQLPAAVAGLPRMGAGINARPSRQPQQPLELFSFESSPFARPVRELLCELELPYVLRSCGRTTASDWTPPAIRELFGLPYEPQTLNRRMLLERAGKLSIPYLVDPNTGTELDDSARIVAYLQDTYAL